MQIVPMRDLKNTVHIEELCKDNGKVFVTKNGYGRLVVMDIDYYKSVFEELEEAKAVYDGLQQMYSGKLKEGIKVMEEMKDKTDVAQKDLDNILDYLTNHLCNFNAAKSFYLLNERIALACDFPESNPIIENRFLGFHEVRKMVIKNYLLYYYVDVDKEIINVLSIRHSLENQKKII